MESISAVIWTFSVSLIMFCLNSKKNIICGTSYERILTFLEEKYVFLKRKQKESFRHKWCRRFFSLSAFRIIELFILMAIGGTAICSYTKQYAAVTRIILAQILALIIFVCMLWHTIRMDSVEKTIKKYIEKNFKLVNGTRTDCIQSNWDSLIVKDSFEQADYIAEERQALSCWLHTVEKIIQSKCAGNDNFIIAMYQTIYSTVLLKDEKFPKRWRFLLENILSSADDIRLDKMKALTYLLVENVDIYDETYLYEFLQKCYKENNDMYIWAAAYNIARSKDANEIWRRIYFRNICEKVANKNGCPKDMIDELLKDEIIEIEAYRKIKVQEVA